MPPSQYDAVQNEIYTYSLATLAPVNSRSIKWELLKDAAVDGKTCRVLKATQANRPAVSLYFDRDSARLLKAAYAGSENFQTATKEYVFSAPPRIRRPAAARQVTVLQAGKRLEEWTYESVRFPPSIDDKEFTKPQ